MYKAKSEIIIEFESEEFAKTIFTSIKPEEADIPSKRTNITLSLNGRKIYLLINAKDTTALRAAMNSYLRLIKVAQNILETVK